MWRVIFIIIFSRPRYQEEKPGTLEVPTVGRRRLRSFETQRKQPSETHIGRFKTMWMNSEDGLSIKWKSYFQENIINYKFDSCQIVKFSNIQTLLMSNIFFICVFATTKWKVVKTKYSFKLGMNCIWYIIFILIILNFMHQQNHCFPWCIKKRYFCKQVILYMHTWYC